MIRKIIRALVIIISCYSCKAQVYPLEGNEFVSFDSGFYFKDMNNNLDKFVGTWKYEDANIKLTVVLQKIEDYEIGSPHSDVIVGNIIYEENWVEIINTLTNPSTSQGSRDIYHIEMYTIHSPVNIKGEFEDPIRSKWTDYTLSLNYIPPSIVDPVPYLKWSVIIEEFYNPDDDIDAEQALRVPQELILTKI